jgi:hypothetical protein
MAHQHRFTPTLQLTQTLVEQQSGETAPEVRQFTIGRALFPFVRRSALSYRDNARVKFERPLYARLQGTFEVQGSEPLDIQFEVNSAWPVDLRIDDQSTMRTEEKTDFFNEIVVKSNLVPGKHRIELGFPYSPREGGLVISYSYWENGWRERETLGMDTPRVEFIPVAEPASVQP